MLIYDLVDIKNYFDQLNDGVDTIKDIKEFVCFEFVWITDDSPIYGYLCSSTFSGTQFMICANTLEDAKNIDEKLLWKMQKILMKNWLSHISICFMMTNRTVTQNT